MDKRSVIVSGHPGTGVGVPEMMRRSQIAAIMDISSRALTAAPIVCCVALFCAFACVRLVLGSWPFVYGDDPGDWFLMLAGVVAFYAYAASRVALVLWAPATGLAAMLAGRPLFLRRLLLFAGGWGILGALHLLDPAGNLLGLLH